MGDHEFYVTAANNSGAESTRSPIQKIVVVAPTTITKPTEAQSPVASPPILGWTTGGSRGYIQVFVEGSNSAMYTKNVSGATSFTYDGPALDPTKKYLLLIHTPGSINRTSDGDVTSDVSFAQKVEKFWVGTATTTSSTNTNTALRLAQILESLNSILNILKSLR